MSQKPRFYVASDYAGVVGGHLSFYYGYEKTIGEGDFEEWCFVAMKSGTETMRVPSSKLPNKPKSGECGECLLAGIAMWMEQQP